MRPLRLSDGTDDGLDLLLRQSAMTQDLDAALNDKHDSRFDADRRRSAIQDQIDPLPERLCDMLGRGRTQLTEGVRTGGGNRQIDEPQEFASLRVRRHSDGDAGQSGRDQIRHEIGLGQHHRERSRPERGGQSASGGRDLTHQSRQPAFIGDMHDQRIKVRAVLGLKDARDRLLVESVSAESVDRLGGKRDEPAGSQDVGCLRDVGGDRTRMTKRIGHEIEFLERRCVRRAVGWDKLVQTSCDL